MSSYLVYNNIVLGVTELVAFKRLHIFDGPTYLYDRVTMHVRCEYNPNAISYVPDPAYAPYIVPKVQDGSYPAVTDNTIRFELGQPRGVLLYVVGNQALLLSPGLQPNRTALYPCDAKGGPYTIVHDVVEHIGRKTYIVDVSVETYINEAWNEMVVAPVCLSHRWTRQHKIDEDFYSTIVTHGHAIFRADVLSVFQMNAGGGAATPVKAYTDRNPATAVVPDDFRNYLFHAVPNGFKRTDAVITPSEDNMALEYTLIDRQVNVIFPDGISRVEAYQHITTEISAGLSGAVAATEAISKWAKDPAVRKGFATGVGQGLVGQGAVAGGLFDVWNARGQNHHIAPGGGAGMGGGQGEPAPGGGAAAAWQAAAQTYLAAKDAMAGNLIPLMAVTISAKVWGDPSASSQDLSQTAYTICRERFEAIQSLLGNVFPARTRAAWGWDMVNSYCDLTVTKELPLPLDIIKGSGTFAAIPDFSSFSPPTPAGLPSGGAGGAVLLNAENVNYPIPNNNRAYYYGSQFPNFESLAAQIFLTNFAGTPPPGSLGTNGSVKAQNMPS